MKLEAIGSRVKEVLLNGEDERAGKSVIAYVQILTDMLSRYSESIGPITNLSRVMMLTYIKKL